MTRILARLDTMKPVKVVAVNAGSGSPPGPGTVDVQPLVSLIDGNGNAVEQGTVHGLPVGRLAGGVWTIVCDPAVGDFGYVVCSDRDISKAVASKGVAAPGSLRRFSVSDGVYVGALLNDVGANYLWLRPDGTLKLTAAGGFVLETDVNGNATITGDLTVTGRIISNTDVYAPSTVGGVLVSLRGHIHPGNNLPPTPGH